MSLRMINYHGWQMLQGENMKVGPYFQNMLSYRLHHKLATNVVITGEAGIGKSYMAIHTCRVLEGLRADGSDRFTVDQIVFTYKEFMNLVLKLKSGKCIIFDEPSYAMGKREWYKDLNRALTQTIESFRFKVHPLFIPIINKNLLDKTVREYLLQYQVNITKRGQAIVYRLRPSQFQDKIYHETFCELYWKNMDNSECSKDSCLGCDQILSCNIFRAQYERKKATIQDSRYEQAMEQASIVETKMKTISELEDMANTCKDKWYIECKINIQKLRIALSESYGINISQNRAYHLKALLESHNKEIKNC